MSVEQQLATLQRLKDNLELYAPECLKIKTKTGKVTDFVLNKAQRYVHEKLEQQKVETGRVRALVLKGRQQGFSTYIGGRFYHKASLNYGVGVFILTHEQPATDNLFAMVSRFHEHTPLRPSTGAANAKELLFPKLDSGYAVATAGQKAVGRGRTTTLFHGSEVAFWPNAKDHFASSVQSVPDLPDTEIILESTANGVGGEFHERWQRAESGEGDYIAIFVPWFWSHEYQRPVKPDFKLSTEKSEDEPYTEYEYAQAHGLTLEQMAWRRAKIAELGHVLFMQEYPATADEAFQSTGHDSYIKPAKVLRARKTTHVPMGQLVLGADPARFGDDGFAVAWRRGRVVKKVQRKFKLDAVSGANWLKQLIDTENPAKVFIDVGGIGAGVYDILVSYGKKYKKIVEPVNFGGEPQEPVIMLPSGEERPGPLNRRAEMWKRSSDWLDTPGGVDIPDEDLIQRDAVAPGYKYNMNQRLVLESKEQMRKRGVASPDSWDAIALTFASPVYDKAAGAASTGQKKKAARHSTVTGATGWMAA
jgi:hypothetical protein